MIPPEHEDYAPIIGMKAVGLSNVSSHGFGSAEVEPRQEVVFPSFSSSSVPPSPLPAEMTCYRAANTLNQIPSCSRLRLQFFLVIHLVIAFPVALQIILPITKHAEDGVRLGIYPSRPSVVYWVLAFLVQFG